MNKEKILKAGKIASEVKKYAQGIIKPGMPLLEIAEKIETKIKELDAKPAFPTNLSINEIAAHYTPNHNDQTKAHGLLKVDFGVHIDGWIADTAFSVDLEEASPSNKSFKGGIQMGGTPTSNAHVNKALIKASKDALENAIKKIKEGATTSEIGKEIQETIESQEFSPIINLSGHAMDQNDLHAGLTIPNMETPNPIEIEKGLYAIEPFATTGSGKVHDGKPSGIYSLRNPKNPRSPIARQVLEFINQEYKTLPFCSRWLVKKFSTKALIALKQLEEQDILHQYPQLVENTGAPVSQAEDTILIEDENVVTTN